MACQHPVLVNPDIAHLVPVGDPDKRLGHGSQNELCLTVVVTPDLRCRILCWLFGHLVFTSSLYVSFDLLITRERLVKRLSACLGFQAALVPRAALGAALGDPLLFDLLRFLFDLLRLPLICSVSRLICFLRALIASVCS